MEVQLDMSIEKLDEIVDKYDVSSIYTVGIRITT